MAAYARSTARLVYGTPEREIVGLPLDPPPLPLDALPDPEKLDPPDLPPLPLILLLPLPLPLDDEPW